MALVLGGIYYGPDDKGKNRPQIAIGAKEVFGGKSFVVLAPLTDYHKCDDKSFSLCDEDHIHVKKDCVVFFAKCRVVEKTALENDYMYKPPPFKMSIITDILTIALSSDSRVPSVIIRALRYCHGLPPYN